jgi:hypothetical protein
MPLMWRSSVVLSLTLAVSGCDLANVLPPKVPPGGRIVVVTVENRSHEPAVLIIGAWSDGDKAKGFARPLQAFGDAQPASVSSGAKVDVRFGVPAGTEWALFVNPGPQRGLLFTSNDAPGETVPFKVVVEPDGEPFIWYPGDPGWFPPQPAGPTDGT